MTNFKTIILDCAHGVNTKGKQSPCGSFKEYQWSRGMQYRIADLLGMKQIPFVIIPTKGNNAEIGLPNRVSIFNEIDDAFVFSLHSNAAGADGKWKQARGVEIWTSRGFDQSDIYANKMFYDIKQNFPELHGDFCKRKFWRKGQTHNNLAGKEANFRVLTSKHSGVLFEWLFQDNKQDVELLLDDNYNERLAKVLANRLELISLGVDKIDTRIIKEKRV